ncbi:cytochrome PufQ [Sedimentitalea todarodis]|uniref:Cytochrome PufQ n=1 Tax=Sedimentitalea todarodis TaxID=1631240 RepID=A0ABU3VKD0_9RHOB|nr:cytochrome PufQ [Sedimentitalea todarodis]MDU9006657.1 cytochrome PufQ [Sedimentitalea todarodis]
MTDMTSNPPPSVRKGRRGMEFWVYFVAIFMFSLPSAHFRWAREVLRQNSLNVRGPMARAWSEADRLTPIIFSV